MKALQMRNLVVCCDGTWNTPDESKAGIPSPTNVAKLSNAAVQDETQLVYYHPGVGTGAGWWDRIVGGGTGIGLDENTMAAYAWLAKTYRPNDRIWLFGFSRGAYTARTCGRLLIRYGLLDLASGNPPPTEQWARVKALYDSYRKKQPFANPSGYDFFNTPSGGDPREQTPIHFVGVWDTVGALGVPDDFALLGLLNKAEDYRFHDTALSPQVKHARHAVAIDEKRASFAPTLWSSVPDGVDAKELYFPGVHSDVGGGYPMSESGLSDGALKWMLEEAEPCGLRLHPGVVTQLKPDPLGILHDSAVGIFGFLKTRPRSVPYLDPADEKLLHESSRTRRLTPPITQGAYWPGIKLAKGDTRTIEVAARERWNATALYLEKGVTYDFAAIGMWVDGKDDYTPDGKQDGLSVRDIAHFASGLVGSFEPIFAKLAGQPHVDFWYTRRLEKEPWMALIGFIANDRRETTDLNDLPVGETFRIGTGCTHTPEEAGYLYCFANDAWQAYGNNRGSVTLTVSRT